MEDIEYNQQTAAAMIIRFLVRVKPTDDFKSLTSFADEMLDMTNRELTNFLDGGSSGQNSPAARNRSAIIVETAKSLFKDLRERSGAFAGPNVRDVIVPSSMIALYDAAFLEDEEEEEPYREALSELADRLAQTSIGDVKRTLRLKRVLADRVYEVYRWTSPSRTKDEPRAIRASMTFLHPSKPTNFLRFQLHYRPYELDPEGLKKNHSITDGVVVPIGGHIYMIGAESNTEYPLIICATIDNDNPQQFRGLVLRRADHKHDLFSARVIFNQNTSVSALEELHDKIGIVHADTLNEEEIMLLEQVNNLVGNDGKQALSYIPFMGGEETADLPT